jgi:PAS domain S-box-containing protein
MASQKEGEMLQSKETDAYALSIINSSNDAIITESLEGNITSWNPAAERMFGYTEEEVIGKPMSIIGPPEKKEEFDALLEKVKKGVEVKQYETERKKKDGRIINVSVTISPIKDNKGNITGVLAIDRDLTHRSDTSQYARSLIEASLDPLVTISPEGKITDVNEATIKATGATRKELTGSRFSDYFTEPGKAEEGYKQVLKEGIVRDYPLTIKNKDNTLMDVLYNASVYKDAKGNVLGVFAAARDITEQKQVSQYARSLIEASVDPLVTISPQGKVTDVNEATIKATGLSRKELIGTSFSEYFTEPSQAEAGYQQVLREGSVRDYPLTIRHKDGKLMEVSYNASVYKDARGRVIGVFAAARDITATKRASQYARSLIEASLDPLVTISTEGKITDVNKATINVTGASKRELIGSDFSQYFTEPGKAKQGYQEVFKKGQVRDYLLTIRNKTGKETPVLYNASVYKDEKGNVIGVFAAAREIGKAELKAARARELQRMSKQLVFKVALSYKMSEGSVKLNEKDAQKAGLDLVDTVIVKPTDKEISGRKISAMSMTASRLPEGMIVLSIPDLRQLGLEEGDTVYIVKSGTEASSVEDDYVPAEPFKAHTPDLKKAEESPSEDSGEGLPQQPEQKKQTVAPAEQAPASADSTPQNPPEPPTPKNPLAQTSEPPTPEEPAQTPPAPENPPHAPEEQKGQADNIQGGIQKEAPPPKDEPGTTVAPEPSAPLSSEPSTAEKQESTEEYKNEESKKPPKQDPPQTQTPLAEEEETVQEEKGADSAKTKKKASPKKQQKSSSEKDFEAQIDKLRKTG